MFIAYAELFIFCYMPISEWKSSQEWGLNG